MSRTHKDFLKRIQGSCYKHREVYNKLDSKDKLIVDNWCSQGPSWWHRMHNTKRRRTKERNLKSQITLVNMEMVWPLDKKPHIYYW